MKNELSADYYFVVFMLSLFAWYIEQPWLIAILVLIWLDELSIIRAARGDDN